MLTDNLDIKEVEISGEAMESFLKGFPEYLQDIAITTLYTFDIEAPEKDKWYNFSNYLKAIEDIGSKFGTDTLYAIGKEALKCSKIPEGITSLKDAFNKLEEAFELNHRNMKICWVTLEVYDIKREKVELIMENPYPYDVNRGILTCMAREFNPNPNKIPEVSIDLENSFSTKGRYIITW